ncbi:cell adhesion molecule 3-like [Lytechinus pictus]|uniref:cell adhesion molecule 3-like n=1 Tax=Lytechinus pictus TaxID=7653 RepID=UPI00240E1555|nr:cell adhesion molecule 3-like [Lytechinus pictus]
MEIRCWMPVLILLCVITATRCQTTVDASSISMGEHPRDTVGVVGGIVTFRCVVRNKGEHSVYWFRHGAHKYLSRDRRIFHLADMAGFMNRISIQGNMGYGEFNLRISNVSLADNDQYSCMYFLGQQFVGMSEPASLTVYMPPTSKGPSCEMQPPNDARPGMKVTMVCTSTGSLPYTRLDWKNRVEILPGTLVQGPRPRALYEVRLTDMDNGATFTCEESSPALYQPRTCFLKPFFIQTNVTVIREPESISTGADVVVRCIAKAIPKQVNYTWTINNRNLTVTNDPRIKLEQNGRVLRIINVKAEDNGTLITCSANNVLNLEGSDYTSLTINSEQLQSVAQTGGSSKHIGIISGIVGTLAILIIVAILAVRKKRQMLQEKPRNVQRQAKHVSRLSGFSDCEYLDDQDFGGVAICNTPRDAIAEHLKENPEDKGPNDDGETAARVLLVAGPPPRPKPPKKLPIIKPVLPPISPVMRMRATPPPLSPSLPSNEMPASLPPVTESRHSPVKTFPAGRLPGMPGKYHAKGPLPRPPRPPTSPRHHRFQRNESDLLRC